MWKWKASILVLILALLATFTVHAANAKYEKTLIATTFNDVTTEKTSDAINTIDWKKVSFETVYLDYDPSGNISCNWTIQMSNNAVNWTDIYAFKDISGGATLQTEEDLTEDGTYVAWLPAEMIPGYLRVDVDTENTTADNTAYIEVLVCGSDK